MSPETLIAWRKRMNLNQKDAAAIIGISANAFRAYERGSYQGKPRPIPLHVALACSAVAQNLPPYGTPLR